MKKYVFRIYQCGDEDGDNVWQTADSKIEAEEIIRSEYYSVDKVIFLREEDCGED